jgi:hypothetical protein
MMRRTAGAIILPSVATRYQLGGFFQAASLTALSSAPTPHGTCGSAMNAAFSVLNAGRKRSEFRLVEDQETVPRRQYGRHGCSPRSGPLIKEVTDSPLSGAKAAM